MAIMDYNRELTHLRSYVARFAPHILPGFSKERDAFIAALSANPNPKKKSSRKTNHGESQTPSLESPEVKSTAKAVASTSSGSKISRKATPLARSNVRAQSRPYVRPAPSMPVIDPVAEALWRDSSSEPAATKADIMALLDALPIQPPTQDSQAVIITQPDLSLPLPCAQQEVPVVHIPDTPASDDDMAYETLPSDDNDSEWQTVRSKKVSKNKRKRSAPASPVSNSLPLSQSSDAPAVVESVSGLGLSPRKKLRKKKKAAPSSPSTQTQSASQAQPLPDADMQEVNHNLSFHSTSEVELTQPTQPQGGPPKKERRPPVIVLKDSKRWVNAANEANSKGIGFIRARNISKNSGPGGIAIYTQTAAQYRGWIKILKSGFYTYDPDKKLRVVIKGIPVDIDNDDIKEDLTSQGFPVLEVHRMRRGNDRSPFDAVYVVLEFSSEGKKIFNIERACGLSGLRVETPRKNGRVQQCHNCQFFGHSARFCKLEPRCVKCPGAHATKDCSRTKDSPGPPICCNCKEEHTANYRKCSHAPNNNRKPPQGTRRGPARSSAPARAPASTAPARAAGPPSLPPLPQPSIVDQSPSTAVTANEVGKPQNAWARPRPAAVPAVAPSKPSTCASIILPPSRKENKITSSLPPSQAVSVPVDDMQLACSLAALDITAICNFVQQYKNASSSLERAFIVAHNAMLLSSLDNLVDG